MEELRVHELTGRVAARSWDRWAAELGASYRGTTSGARALAARGLPRDRVRWLTIQAGGERSVIGMCAVITRAGGGSFADRLALRDADGDRWREAMAAVLERLGPGTYEYGWNHSLEQPREDDLAAIAGVHVEQVRPLTVHSVEFADWASWDDYHRAISTNVKRNVKKAQATYPELAVQVRHGLGSVSHLPALIRLRAEVYQRKGIGFQLPRTAIGTFAGLATQRRRSFTAVAVNQGETLAAFRGVRFAGSTTYLDGGSAGENAGASWFLLVSMLEDAYRADPAGRMVMGYLDEELHDDERSGGLLRQRRSCRVREFPTSMVRFRWDG